jgi:Cof subfamily protein (haloacid dehalogenase superfamily)
MRPRLLALDLDGTLLDEECQLPMGHAFAIKAIRRLGITVAIATGRGLMTARLPWEQIGGIGPLVCFNGGWIGHPQQGQILSRSLSEKNVHDIMAALAQRDGVACCYPDALTWVMSHETRLTRTWRHLYQVDIQIQADIRTAWSGNSLKVLYVDTPEQIQQTCLALSQHFRGRFEVVISQPDRLEVLPLGITKGWGVQQLAAHMGISREAVWAVGDADNDREMIRWAGNGCVMGQASDRLKNLAKYVLPSIQARGLCALLPLLEKACLRA